MNHRSVRQSPGDSAPLSCHCTSRCVLVNDPSISGTVEDGKKKTSVWMADGSATSGARQKSAVSVTKMSLTTSQSSCARPARW